MKPILKSITWSVLFLAMLAIVNGCQKEEIKTVEPIEEPQPEILADSCCTYCVTLTIDNPDHTFNLFLNNVPAWGNFEACTGDTISMGMTQDCVAFGGCSQWTVDIMKNGTLWTGVAGEGSFMSYIYIVP